MNKRAEEMVDHIKSIHEEERKKIENSNLRCKTIANQHCKKVIFKVGDKVWVVPIKKRFPIGVIKLIRKLVLENS